MAVATVPKLFVIGLASIAISSLSTALATADDRERGHHRPVYQRRAFEWGEHHHDRFRHARRPLHAWVPPQVNAGWYQRPYPYHLDYYKIRYGGSYAPYFGNLYGPPQVVTAPPYYGPYYGGEPAGDQAYPPAYEALPVEAPLPAPGAVEQGDAQ